MISKRGVIELAPGADENGLAVMLADLVKANIEASPGKKSDFDALKADIAIVAEDAQVALTLRFRFGHLTIFDGIESVPDVTVRGDSNTILALSNWPVTRRFGLPFPEPRDKEGIRNLAQIFSQMRRGAFHAYGAILNMRTMLRLTRIMSVNG